MRNTKTRHGLKHRTVTRGTLGLILVLIVGYAQVAPSCVIASLYVGPRRPLSDEERLEYSALRSDAVLKCTVLAVVDTLTSGRYSAKDVRTYPALVVLPTEWIKGQGPLKPLLVGYSQFDSNGSELFKALRGRVPIQTVLFVRQISPTPKDKIPEDFLEVNPVSAEIDWYLNCNPNDWHSGVFDLTSIPNADAQTQTIRDVYAKQSIESMAGRADLAVVAERQPSPAPCEIDGKSDSCTSFRVLDVILGRTNSETIVTYSIFGKRIGSGQYLILAKATGLGTWEILGVRANGVMKIEDGNVPQLGTSLNSAISKIRSVASKRGNLPSDD